MNRADLEWNRGVTAPETVEAARSGDEGKRPRVKLPDPLTAVVVIATAIFALAGIGSPLLGLSVFADTGSLAGYSGYRDVLAGVPIQLGDQRDMVDNELPSEILFGEALRSGEFVAWNPYAVGGAPLAAIPNAALSSPLSLPFWVMPGWLAPGYVKLLELSCAVGGMVLFLRRLRLGRPAAWLGGLVFAGSAFMVVWTGYPTTRVAALIPALFWAVERLAQRPRVREVALTALVVTGMLLGGFPAVTGYALVTAAVYLLVRVLADHGRAWRPILGRLLAAGAGLVAGLGLAAWQLVPWIRYMSTVLVFGRAQEAGSHIHPESLLTAIAPDAFGSSNPAHPPAWFGSLLLIDSEAYLGAAALVLVVTAIALARPARALLPRGIWWLLVGAAALWTMAIFFGGPVLALLQQMGFLFSANFVGRARSVLGFLGAVLAAVGFELVLRGRAAAPGHDRSRTSRRYGVAIWLCLLVGGGVLYAVARGVARHASAKDNADGAGPDYLSHLNAHLGVGLAIMAIAALCAGWLWWGRLARWPWPRQPSGPWARNAFAGVIVLLLAGQGLWWAQTFYPRTERENFYPTNPTQEFLAAHLGHNRYYGADGAIFGSVDIAARLRSFHGHSFIDEAYAELAETLPGEQFTIPASAIISDPADGVAAISPMLDRAAVTYYVTPPQVRPFGPVHGQAGDGTVVTLNPGVTVIVPLPVTGPVRGVGFTPAAKPAATAVVTVVLRDATGQVVAAGERIDREPVLDHKVEPKPTPKTDLSPKLPWFVPIAGEDVPPGTRLTAEITLKGPAPMNVAASGGLPAVSAVSAAQDGLRLVYAQETVIYHRTRALPRARWAPSTVVVPDPGIRVRMLANGEVGPNQVVLNTPGPAATGAPARVEWLDDGLNRMTLRVDAQGAGYLVLADALQHGWKVSVDGVDAPLVPADHAFVAVAVSAGSHLVRFSYPGPAHGTGIWITGGTALALLLALAAPRLRRRTPAGS